METVSDPCSYSIPDSGSIAAAGGTGTVSYCATYAQDQRQELLRQAVHCLAVKNFLLPPKAAKRTFSYLLDEKSYLVGKVLYVVEYQDLSRSNGINGGVRIYQTGHDNAVARELKLMEDRPYTKSDNLAGVYKLSERSGGNSL